jgi:hypothetical protein
MWNCGNTEEYSNEIDSSFDLRVAEAQLDAHSFL